jgi:hypothetical protein
MKGTVETSQDEDLLAPRGIGETLCPQQIKSNTKIKKTPDKEFSS